VPLATLVTPNAPEAALLAGCTVHDVASAREAAKRIADLGVRHVLVKGGHLDGARSIDVLLTDGVVHELDAPRITTRAGHGTGCTLSAAITARLALGESIVVAVVAAKKWLSEALSNAPDVGHGTGPVDHFVPVRDLPRP
jgi:hydroxymethylpyrimidine kinase/phosphomethylpyrimidine kinase